MPDTWPFEELGRAGVEVLDCEHKTPSGSENGYPYIAIPNLVDGRLNLDQVRRISRVDLEAWTRRTRPQEGDVIVTRRGRVGDSAVVPPGIDCAIGQNLVILRSNGSNVDQAYLRWAARGPFWLEEVDRLINVGAVFSSLNVRDIPRIRIFLPPLDTQRTIARILRAFDDKIAVNARIATICNDLAEAHMARTAANAGRARLAEVAVITMGSSPPGETYNEAGIGLPFYQGTRDFGVRFPTRRVWCSEPIRVALPKSTLVSVRAPVGRVNAAAEECCIGRGLAALVSRARTPSVLYHVLKVTPEIWQPFESGGTVFGAINKSQMENLPVAAFDAATAQSLEDLLSPLDARVGQTFQENTTLTELRDTLLPKLMSGEIRVRGAEKAVEEAT